MGANNKRLRGKRQQEEWDIPPSYLKYRFVPSLSQDQLGPKQGEGGWEQTNTVNENS